MASADRPAVGVRRTPTGWQAYIRINGELRAKRFPADTPLGAMKTWRARQHARATLDLPATEEGSDLFHADCARYLRAVAGMTTISDRTYRIKQWARELGNVPRQTITSVQIRAVLERWKTAGLSHGSLNLRRTALMHMFHVLNGRQASNPVRDVPRYRETPPLLTLPSLADASRAIAAVGDRSRDLTRVRLQVLLWTGWPAKQLMRLTPADVDWTAKTAHIQARQKGHGSRARVLPLLPQAVKALKAFNRADAWGPFSTSAMHSSLHRGCDRVGVARFHPYAVRHLFGTIVATITGDDRVVAELLMHSDLSQTRRYTEQSVDPRVLAGLEKVRRATRKQR